MAGRLRFFERYGLRIAIPAILVLIGTIATVVYSLREMAEEADRLEANLTSRSVTAAIQSVERHLGETHGDYAVWDDAVRALYGHVDGEFIAQNFAASTATPTFFDTTYLLDEQGNEVFGYRLGESTKLTARETFGTALDYMLGRLPQDGQNYDVQSGLLSTPFGIVAVAVGPVVPNTEELKVPVRKPRMLIVAKAIDEEALTTLGEDFVIRNLRFAAGNGENTITLADPTGRTIAHLGWDLRELGTRASASVSPTIIGVLGLLVVMTGLLIAIAVRGVNELRRREQVSHHDATHDALTGLPNRTALIEALERAIAGRGLVDEPAVLVYLDLDGFKGVNDAYGHETGDRLLRLVATRFRTVSGADLLARLGGDEFAFLAAGPGARERARVFGAAAVGALRAPFDLDGRVIVVGTSIGIANADSFGLSGEEVLRRADVAMYHAKQHGPNRSSIYDSGIDTMRHERLAVAADLRRALNGETVAVAYQPVFDAATREVVAIEALARWNRNGEPMPPADFVAIAEESGLIEDLGAFVLRRACSEALGWQGIRLSVNVSPAQFRNPTFPETVAAVLRETGFPANRLELEVTETYLIEHPDQAREAIDALRGLGVSVALDDFGTGYSSIGYLRRFRFDKLKLDRSLVASIATDEGARRLVQATIAVADALGLKVTAEGVETEDQAVLLRAAGCDELQGFLLARPSPAAVVSRLVERSEARALRSA